MANDTEAYRSKVTVITSAVSFASVVGDRRGRLIRHVRDRDVA
ncbi:hypothetical protein ACVH9Z_24195 [Rhodococcus opacus]|nr:hypothetical protein [Rhodococcus opacus]MDX5967760.1 hypothetical protein [Rhodococcus opacus]